MVLRHRIFRQKKFHIQLAKRRGWVALGGLLVLAAIGIFSLAKLMPTHADITQNNNTGQMTINFTGNNPWAGISNSNNVNIADGVLRATDPTQNAYLVTSEIRPTSSGGWGNLTIAGTWTNADNVRAMILDCATGQPVSLPGNVEPGVPVSQSGQWALNAAALQSVACIQIKFNLLAPTPPDQPPSLTQIGISWQPQAVLLARLTAPATVQAGQNINYKISYSVSFVDSQNVVIYAPLPTASNQTPAFGQNLGLVFDMADNGGQYTATAITVNGVNIPANSVYWNLGNLPAGSAGMLSYSLKTQNGWENGTTYAAQAVVTATGAQTKQGSATTTIASTPGQQIEKKASGTVNVSSENNRQYVYQEAPYNGRATYNIKYGNFTSSNWRDFKVPGGETLFNPVLTDDLSSIANFLTDTCGVADWTTKIINIGGGGTLNASAKTLTWSTGNLAPGQTFTTQFTVDYLDCYSVPAAIGQDVGNTVTGTSAKTNPIQASQPVRIFGLADVKGAYAKGENGRINANRDDPIAPASDPADMEGKIAYGQNTTFHLYTRNEGVKALRDTVMQDKIPVGTQFVSAALPPAAGGTIYYNTSPSAASFNWQNPTSNGWTTALPLTASDVAQVAFYVPCLQSSFSNMPASLCAEGIRPSDVAGNITVRIAADAYDDTRFPVNGTDLTRTTFGASPICSVTSIRNLGNFASYNGGSTPVMTLLDPEWTHGSMPMPELRTRTTVTGPALAEAGTTANYTFTIGNSSANAVTKDNTELRIILPQVLVGSTTKSLEYGSLTGGVIDSVTTDANGSTVLTIHPGVLEAGASRTYTLPIIMPLGVLDGAQLKIVATLNANDVNSCQPLSISASQDTTITGVPKLNITKQVKQNIILPAGDIDYQINLNSIGGKIATRDTFIIDQIPLRTIFDQATCTNCTVYFLSRSAAQSLGGNISPMNPVDPNWVFANFSPGVQAGTTWLPPVSMTNSEVEYVAYLVGDASGSTRVFNSGSQTSVGLHVKNDDDGGGPNTAGSNQGTLINNAALIISNESLLAVGNTVHTTIYERPGLMVNKTASADNVRAGQQFEWYVDYYNDASEPDTVATLIDTLPAGVKLDGVYNTWNAAALSGGASPSGEFDLMSTTYQDSVDIARNNDGTTTITIRVAGGLLSTLDPTHGGRLRIVATASDTAETGSSLINTVEGVFASASSGPFSIFADSLVGIQNPDLYLRKTVSNTNPRAGQTVTYTLTLSNEGLTDAPDAILTDTLPAGMCYVAGSVKTLTSGWTLAEPTVSGGNCATSATTLTWSGGQINGPGADANIPARSGNILITYNVRVDGNVQPGSTKPNLAHVSTGAIEDTNFTNDANAEITTPIPDPYVVKTASSPSVLPGETFSYQIRYGNHNNEKSAGVYLVDELPTLSGGDPTKTAISILSVTGSNNETIWYYDANTASQPLSAKNITANYNFAADPDFHSIIGNNANAFYPTHFIVVDTTPDNDGIQNYFENSGTITVEAQAIDPYTGQELGQGSQWTNVANIYSSTLDADLTNNVSSATVAVPSADLAIEKSADVEGTFPGTTPGSAINYTITYKNVGIGNVCGVRITDTLPAAISATSSNFTKISVADRFGNPLQLMNPSGQPIDASTIITPTMVDHGGTITWYLGTNSGSASDPAHYTQVCLPQGAIGSFNVSATVDGSTLDNTTITNQVRIDQDIPGVTEDILSNNQASTSTVAYRSDLRLIKTAVSSGADGVIGTADDSTDSTNPGETVRYTLSYNNIGHTTAENSVITENIPDDTCFTPGSIANLPATATVEYSNDGGSTWDYTPSGNPDCNITSFRINLGNLSAPANMISGSTVNRADLGEVGYMDQRTDALGGLTVKQISSGDDHTCALASDGWVYCWGYNSDSQLGNGTTNNSTVPVAISRGDIPVGATIKQVSAGEWHACVLASNDQVYCWGSNYIAQLGNAALNANCSSSGCSSNSTTPVAVDTSGALAGKTVKQVSAGFEHTCVLASDDQVYCWGSNTSGQLGTSTGTTCFLSATNIRDCGYTPMPVDTSGVLAGKTIKQVVAGLEYTCAIANDDWMYCWGRNDYGELGNGSTGDQNTPVAVIQGAIPAGVTFKQISTGYNLTCALASDNWVYCWGKGSYGQLGDGTNTDRLTPAPIINGEIPAGVTITGISDRPNEVNTCAIASNGWVYCWGSNRRGNLGNGNTTDSNVPVAISQGEIPAGSTFSQVTAGGWTMTCALSNSGQAYCWGGGNILGNGKSGGSTVPVAVGTTTQVIDPKTVQPFIADSASSDDRTACAIADGQAYCWGYGGYGNLGNDLVANISLPTKISSGAIAGSPLDSSLIIKQISVGDATCAIAGNPGTDNNDQLYCWGRNNYGQLGNGDTISSNIPIQVSGGAIAGSTLDASLVIKQVSSYGKNVCAVAGFSGTSTNDQLYCWGYNYYGQLGNGTSNSGANPLPIKVSGGAIAGSPLGASLTIKQISVGDTNACVITSDDQLYCWGYNGSGELGNGTTSGSVANSLPIKISGGAIAGSPLVTGLVVKQIAAARWGTACAIAGAAGTNASDQLYCWGQNDEGQLGNGDTISSSIPIQVSGGAIASSPLIAGLTVKQVLASYVVCAIAGAPNNDSSDQLYCWGSNWYGQVGNGIQNDNDAETIPVQISGGAIPGSPLIAGLTVKQVSGDGYNYCATAGIPGTNTSNKLYCWGSNTYGQAGNGSVSVYPDSMLLPSNVLMANNIPTSSIQTAVLAAAPDATIKSYNDIYIDQRVGRAIFTDEQTPGGDGGTVNYYLRQMMGGVCGLGNPAVNGFADPIFSAPANQNTGTVISAAALAATTTSWCVVAEYIDAGDVVSTARISYTSPDDPSVSFDVVVNRHVQRSLITNIASIDTPTPEITKANNTGQADLRVLQADLALTKDVDQAALSLSDAQTGTAQLTYRLTVTNNGPNDAALPQVVDNLPSSLTFVSATQISSSNGAGGSSTVNFTCAETGGTITCASLTPLPVGQSAVIQVVATVQDTVTANAVILNTACASSSTADRLSDNNCDQAITTIATAPNVFARKTGPTAANVGKQFNYTITVGNNGNAVAPDWQFTDTIDSNLSIINVDVTSQTGVGGISCNVAGQVVTCTTPDGNLPIGSSAVITITVQVADNQSLADNNTVTPNTACSQTSATQTTISDDCSNHDVQIVPGAASIITGRVFVDRSHSVTFDPKTDRGIPGVTITLTSTDSRGNAVTMTTTTDASGFYTFINVLPGKYQIVETQPNGYYSTGSTAGFFATAPNGDPILNPLKDGRGSVQDPLVSPNHIVDIVVAEGEVSQRNDFGEDVGGIGNMVWNDANRNGFLDPGEAGIGGVEISLYADINGNGVYDSGVDVLVGTTFTDALGNYNFDYVPLGNYIVVVTDVNHVLSGMFPVAAPAGHETEDNWSKNPAGYAVSLTSANPSDQTADFGFSTLDDPVISVTKTDSVSGQAEIGDSVVYTVTVSNTVENSHPATDLTVTDVLPSTLDYIGNTGGDTWNSGTRTITWTISSLAYGTPAVFTISATVNSTASTTAPGNTILNTATVTGDTCANAGSVCTYDNTITVVPHPPILTITKDDGVTVVEKSHQLTYAVVVTNTRAGSSPATNVNITDTIPTNTTFVSATDSGSYSSGKVSWTIPSVANGTPVTVYVTVQVKDDGSVNAGDQVINTANIIDSTNCGTTPTAGWICQATDTDTVVLHSPAVQISKAVSASQIQAEGQLTYTLTVTNSIAGSSDATNVILTDTLPANVTYVSSSDSGTYNSVNRTVIWTIPSVAYGTPVNRTITVSVNNNVTSGDTIVNNAAITHNTCPTDLAQGEVDPCADSATTTVLPRDPIVKLTKTGPATAQAGSQVTYTITATNTMADSNPAQNVVITDVLPSEVSFVSTTEPVGITAGAYNSTTHEVTWTIPSLANGSPMVFTITATVNAGTASGTTIHNYVTSDHQFCIPADVQAGTDGSCLASHDILVDPQDPKISIAKVVDKAQAEIGDNLTYTVTASNTVADSGPATNLTIVDTLPAGLDYVSSSPAGTWNAGARTVTWTISSLAYGTNQNFTILATVNDSATVNNTLTNSATISGATCTTSTSCTATADTTVIPHPPVLTIAKTDYRTTVEAGDTTTYDITITNTRAGSSPATNINVTDTLPTNTTFVSATGGGTESGGVVTWTIPSVVNGTPVTVHLTVRVNDNVAENDQVINTTNINDTTICARPGSICQATDTNTVVLHNPALTVEKVANVTSVQADGEITYTLTISNLIEDSYPATGVTLTDILPPNTTFVSATGGVTPVGGKLTWTSLTVPYGTPVQKTVTVRANNNVLSTETIDNRATIDHSSCQSAEAIAAKACESEVRVTVDPRDPVVNISKSASLATAWIGDQITYYITVTNPVIDSTPADNVTVVDSLPSEVKFLSTTEPSGITVGTYNSTTHEVSWTIPSVTYGHPVILAITVEVGDTVHDSDMVHNYASHDFGDCPAAGASCAAGADVKMVAPSEPPAPPVTPEVPDTGVSLLNMVITGGGIGAIIFVIAGGTIWWRRAQRQYS